MGKPDVYESDYLENAEIFADLINGVLYQGEQVVKPQALKEQDGELRSIQSGGVKKTVRDKVRLWNGNTILAIFALENQTKVDYHMVLRAMLAESMAYEKQWKKRKKELEQENGSVTADEFISGMRKEEKFTTIITVVVYYGREKPWDGAKTLYDLLDVEGNEEKILPFISNYRLNVFDYHEYDDFSQFHSELQSFFEFLRYSGDKEKLKEKLRENRENYGSLSAEAKALLVHLTNIKEIPDVGDNELEKGEFDMCKAFEDMKEEGRTEGKIEGKIEGRAEEIVEMGYEFGLSENEIMERLQNKLDISVEEAEKYLGMFKRQAV